MKEKMQRNQKGKAQEKERGNGHKFPLLATKLVAFVLLLALVLIPIRRTLEIKAIEHRYFSAISTYKGFYRMRRNTVDVLFLGSSHAYCSFSPQELYDAAGLRSYNLGSSQQSVIMSYYWLKEALRYQQPRAVVLETFYTLFPTGNEGSVHKSFDYMRWSPVKLQAGIDLIKNGPQSLSVSGLIFPLIRYHDRWKELNADDFASDQLRAVEALKGYSPIFHRYGKGGRTLLEEQTNREPFVFMKNDEKKDRIDHEIVNAATRKNEGEGAADDSRYEKINPLSREYLDRIVQLCREKDISLILVKTPTTDKNWQQSSHDSLANYAADQGLDFYDFNTKELYHEIGYDFANDNGDSMHPNLQGADKLTDYMGELLLTCYHVPAYRDDQWSTTRTYVDAINQSAVLTK